MFKRLFLVANVCLPLLAWAADYSRCAHRFSLSMEKVGKSYGVAINENQLLYYGKSAPQGFRIIKSDPFVGFYLLGAKRKMIPLELRDLNDEAIDGILGVGSPNGFTIGKVTKRMEGFLQYASFSAPTPQNSVISSVCFQFYGLGTGDGFIESSYIKRFLNGNNFSYGELGALFIEKNHEIFVDYTEPFVSGVNLQIGDRIIELNGQKPTNFDSFLQAVYSLKPGTTAKLKVSRDDEIIDIDNAVIKRTGGMLLPYHYLSSLGMTFDSQWNIARIDSPPNGFEKLEVGDRILKINNIDMPQGFIDGAKLFSKESKKPMKILVSRGGFQFFVTIGNDNKQVQWGSLLSEQ